MVAAFKKQNPPIGARPGTLVIPKGSPTPRIHLFHYSPAGASERAIADVEEIPALLRDDGVRWVDVQGLGDERVLRRLGEIFSLHPLALEDAVNAPQRAKSELYEHQQLVVARMPMLQEDGSLEAPQVCFFICRDVLVTFQERYFGFFDPVRERIRAGVGPIWSLGPDYLAYALVDTLIDRYYPLAERISSELEDLEDAVVERPAQDTLAQIHRLRRQLVFLRRIGWPQREAIRSLMSEPSPFVSHDVQLFLRDTHDHIAQIMEVVDSGRELSVALTDMYLSNVSHRTNEVMKVLTILSSIFIPLTFVAGIYGMNFEHMPELQSPVAYPLVLGTMFAIGVGMVLFFRRRGWIGRRRS